MSRKNVSKPMIVSVNKTNWLRFYGKVYPLKKKDLDCVGWLDSEYKNKSHKYPFS